MGATWGSKEMPKSLSTISSICENTVQSVWLSTIGSLGFLQFCDIPKGKILQNFLQSKKTRLPTGSSWYPITKSEILATAAATCDALATSIDLQ